MFSTLRAEERQMLLHVRLDYPKSPDKFSSRTKEGTGIAVMSAYVEIVFDNTDFRIPVSTCGAF
jgi:hypothetical protein